MSLFSASELAELRGDAESLMTVKFAAYAPGITTDQKNRKVPGGVLQGHVWGKVTGGRSGARDATTQTYRIGDVDRPVLQGGLHLPVCAFVVDDVLQIKAGDRTKGWEFLAESVCDGADPSLVGNRYLVVGVPAKAFATARRMDVVEVPW